MASLLVIFRGLPGTGKTYLVRKLLSKRPDLLVLSRDVLRTGMIPHPTFSEDEKAFVDELILAMSDFLLEKGRSVVIDGMALSSARLLAKLAGRATARYAGFRIIECVCSEATALARIAKEQGMHPAGDRGPDLYYHVRDRFESTELPFLSIDTDGDEQQNVAAILGYLENPPV